MIAPALTEADFKKLQGLGFTSFKTLGQLNSKNCKANFSPTIPKALREEGFNAFLIVKNHRNRYKYLGFNVEEVAGTLKVTTQPEILWSGYVKYDRGWWAVDGNSFVKGSITNKEAIILPQIEFEEE